MEADVEDFDENAIIIYLCSRYLNSKSGLFSSRTHNDTAEYLSSSFYKTRQWMETDST